MCFFIFHNWRKWQVVAKEKPEVRLSEKWVLSACIERHQERECLRCGLKQVKHLDTTII